MTMIDLLNAHFKEIHELLAGAGVLVGLIAFMYFLYKLG